jgi:hypothetical protein
MARTGSTFHGKNCSKRHSIINGKQRLKCVDTEPFLQSLFFYRINSKETNY